MLTMSPLAARPTNASQPPELAWPTALARGAQGEFLGYAMRRFGEPAHIQLIGLFTRAQRRKLFPERADWRFLLGAAWNLAFMTSRIHHDNLVIGDFSSSNVVVDANGFVFALAVLVHLLLTAGNHRAFGLSGIEPDQPHAPNGPERTGPGVLVPGAATRIPRVVRSGVPDRTATLPRQPESTESLEADDHTIEPYLAGGCAGGRRETAPGLMTAHCERPRSSR
ncbi:hypothetical protein OOK36_27520 [Streptomyces sp. NBC_00365]|uniref:hypothetical protein n=1 Tax=Streptomyces sp. NBC_00365 TaxID=2975726 RepID=UPI00225A2745|nr:hypothetical protein [Streptomyces sp. NBC_00365]MCX5092562.1 hypothetical protein [Streptomyces sp. NBC_00365]